MQRARNHRLRAGVDGIADHVLQTQARDLLRVQSKVLEERPVDVQAKLVLIDVCHRSRHAVHDRAQLRFARREGVLRLLQVRDVVTDDVVALDRRIEAHVGNDLVSQPAAP